MIELPTPNKVQKFLASSTAKSIATGQSYQNHAILLILIIFLVIGVVTGLGIFIGYVNTNKNKLQKNWKNLRCKPQYMPFASMIGPKGSSFGKNFSSCMSTFFEDNFNHFISPYLKMFTSLTGIVAGLSHSVQRIREMLTAIRDNLEDYAKTIILRLKMTFLRIQNLFRIFQAFFSRLASAFIAIGNIFKYLYYIGASIWNGPAGWFFRFFLGALDGDCCFDGDTKIEMENGLYKKISDLKIGDKLKKGGKVNGVFEFEPRTQMYGYKGIIVSGTHRVFSNNDNKFIEISKMKEAKPIVFNKKRIYCINTESGRINIGENVFMDYRDCLNNEEEEKINRKIFKKLNGFEINEAPLGFGGIDKDILVKMNNGDWLPISEIKIGDKLSNNNKVYGNVLVETMGGYFNNKKIASSQLIENNNSYYFFNKNEKIMELNQLFCETHCFYIKINDKEYLIRDFEQIKL